MSRIVTSCRGTKSKKPEVGFGVVGIQYLGTSIDSNDLAEVLYIPLWPIQLVLPYAFFSSALRHATFAVWPDLKPSRAVEEG